MASPKPFVITTDNHGDMQDDATVAALFDFIGDFKPKIRVHAGDCWDFRNLRRGASDEEKAASLEGDWEAGTDLFLRFFSGGWENYFLFGNHDDRLFQFQRSAKGVLRDYATDGIKRVEKLCKKRRVTTFPYDSALGILKLGDLSVLHGYHAGVNAARHHANVYGNCVFGHVHTAESAPVASLKPAEARSIPCTCIRDMDYCNARTGKLRWAQGWAYGLLFDDNSYHLEVARKINGRFVYATDFRVG
jgi:hypothetical protein